MNEAIFAQDTATIARLRDENLAKLRRIEHMRLELMKLGMDIETGKVDCEKPMDRDEIVHRLNCIRGMPA